MTIPSRIERTYRVRFDEAGPDGFLRSSGFLRYAQDLAWIHSELAGFGRDWYQRHGLTWLVRGIELDVLTDVPYGTELAVSTEVTGFRRVWARRRSVFAGEGEERPVAAAIIDWVLLNARGAPTTVPKSIAELFATSAGRFTPLRTELPPAPADAAHQLFPVRRSELDPMAHVNNASYLDYLDEQRLADRETGPQLGLPRRYRAEFLASAEPGRMLAGRGWPDGLAWCYLLEYEDDGRELLRARLETDPAKWVGG